MLAFSTIDFCIIVWYNAREFADRHRWRFTMADSVGLEYKLSEDGMSYIVSGIGTCTDADIVIPSEYNGKPVTSISWTAFSYCKSLNSVVIPSSVIIIGMNEFRDCENLTSITIPSSVGIIGDSAFEGCGGLTSISIPSGVRKIRSAAFWKCKSLADISISNGVTSIGEQAFYGCSSLTSITIPNSVTIIAYSAFEDCNSLTSVVFEDPNGWYAVRTKWATSGIDLTLTDATQNATCLKSTYLDYYWYKKTE